jgi:hypothetical protein
MNRILVVLAVGLLFFSGSVEADTDLKKFSRKIDESLDTSGKNFSIESGVAYSYWNPQDIGNAEMQTSGINLFWVELKSKTLRTLQNSDSIFSIPKLRYETSLTGDQFNFDENEVIRASDNEHESYIRFLGMLQVYKPLTFRYETETYICELKPKTDMTYVPYSEQGILNIRKGDELYYETTFHDYALEYEYDDNCFFGIFYGEYQKPYSATISGTEISPHTVFYSKFKSWGIIWEYVSNPLAGSLESGFTMDGSFKIGWGKTELTDNYKLSSQIATDKGIAFFNPEIIFGYQKYFYDNFMFHSSVSIDYRFFYQYDKNSGETDAVLGSDDINSDLLLKCFMAISYVF